MINNYVPGQVHFIKKKYWTNEWSCTRKQTPSNTAQSLSENFPLLFYTHSCAVNFVFFLSEEKTVTEIALICAWLIADPQMTSVHTCSSNQHTSPTGGALTVIGQRFTHQIKPEESHCKNKGAHCVCSVRGCTPQHRQGTLKLLHPVIICIWGAV